MNAKMLIRCVVIGSAAIAIIVIIARSDSGAHTAMNAVRPRAPEGRVVETSFYHEAQFARTVELARGMDAAFPAAPVRAGIIPHDVVWGQYIAHFFQRLADDPPSRIVLIGPNHFETGSGTVHTTLADWDTAFGRVQADQDAVGYLLERRFATADDYVATHEHSIAAIVPYVSYYVPNARIVPLILKSELTLGDITLLAGALEGIVNKETVVIAAVDFSHYRTAAEAEAHDAVTEKALNALDYEKILSFGPRFNDYVDSPPSIALLLYWLSEEGITGSTILYHTNSGIVTGNKSGPTTSYFEVAYY